MHFALNQEIDLATLADLAEIALEQGQDKLAIRLSEKGLLNSRPLHAERVRFYSILIRAHFALEDYKDAERCFQELTDTLGVHLGPYHPLHITVYGIMVFLMVPKGQMEEAMYLYKSSLVCSMKALGLHHIQTAHVHMDMG